MKRPCIQCGRMFRAQMGTRICSAGCRHARKTQQARASNSKRPSRSRFALPHEPVEMAVVLPFNPSDPFLTDAQRRVCAEARA